MQVRLLKAKQFLSEDNLFNNNEIKDRMQKIEENGFIHIAELKACILQLQNQTTSIDYLNHNAVDKPILFLDKVPPIYCAIYELIELVLDETSKLVNLSVHKKKKLRRKLVQGEQEISSEIDHWFTYGHYYQMPNQQYTTYRHVIDRIIVDKIIRGKYYSCYELIECIQNHATQYESQPA